MHVVVRIHTVSGHAVRPVAAAFLHHYVVYPCQRRTGRSGIANRLGGWDCWRCCGNEWSVRGGLSPLYSAIALASFSGSRSSAPEAFRVTLFMKWYVGQFAVVPLPDVSNPEVH